MFTRLIDNLGDLVVMSTKMLNAIFKSDMVIVPLQEDADLLLNNGYGIAYQKNSGSQLAPAPGGLGRDDQF